MSTQVTREVVETEYSSSEMKELWNMSADEIVAILKFVNKNRLPLYYYKMDNINELGEEHAYSEKDYFNTKEHAAVEMAIELLEKEQDYCTWIPDPSNDRYLHRTKCGMENYPDFFDLIDNELHYCPYCGKKIRFEEENEN